MEFTITKQQRGPTLNLVCSVLMRKSYIGIQTSTNIDLDDAAVALQFQGNGTNCVQVSIRVKKNDKAMKSVAINVNCGEFNEIILCSDQWKEVLIMKNRIRDKYVDTNEYVYLYNFTVNIITVHDIMCVPTLSSNKLHADTEFTDFQLHSENGSVPVHKAVLFIHSDMFKTMLSGEWKETTEGRINIEGVTMETLQHLKDYMYLGTLPDEGLEQLLVIASRYLMDNLKTDCITKLVKTMKPENFDALIELACQNQITELVKALVLQIPDDIVNGIHQLRINKECKSNDKQ